MKKSEPLACPLEGVDLRQGRATLSTLLSRSQERRCALLLAVTCIPVGWFLAHTHAFVPMWFEGLAECNYALMIMLGIIRDAPPGWIHYGGLHLSLALNAYIGPAFFYFHLPAAYLWFHGLTKDPYLYRYLGIFFFSIASASADSRMMITRGGCAARATASCAPRTSLSATGAEHLSRG